MLSSLSENIPIACILFVETAAIRPMKRVAQMVNVRSALPGAPEDTANSQNTMAVLKLRQLILSGQLRAGERVAEIPLATRLKVSRTPLRLALTMLEHEGLLELHHSRGFVVRSFTTDDIRDAIELRGVLEGTVARLAAERLTDSASESERDLNEIQDLTSTLNRTLHSALSGLESLQTYIELNSKFHKCLLKLARSNVLTREMERMEYLPFASPNAGFIFAQADLPASREILLIGLEHHRAMVEAIKLRAGTRAESLAREHSKLSWRNLEIALQNDATRHLIPGLSLILGVGSG